MDPHNLETGNPANPARVALIARNNQPQRTFATVERLAVATIGQQNGAVVESGVEFRQREENAVAVRRAGDYAQGHVWAFQLFAQRSTCFLQNLHNRHPCIPNSSTLVVSDGDCLSSECCDVCDAEIEKIWHLATDAEGDGVRRLRSEARGRPQKHHEQR